MGRGGYEKRGGKKGGIFYAEKECLRGFKLGSGCNPIQKAIKKRGCRPDFRSGMKVAGPQVLGNSRKKKTGK